MKKLRILVYILFALFLVPLLIGMFSFIYTGYTPFTEEQLFAAFMGVFITGATLAFINIKLSY